MTTTTIEIEGHTIQVDRSGVGHNWRNVAADEIPANILEEIAAEIIDGGVPATECYVASNGLHYRW